jgi:hypothetical protein
MDRITMRVALMSLNPERMLTKEEVGQFCPACKQKMMKQGIKSVSAKVLQKAAGVKVASWMTDLERYFGNKALATSKDYQRIEDIYNKAMKKYSDQEDIKYWMRKLAIRMARTIAYADKAYRRARAAEDDNYHDLADIFFDRARELWSKMRVSARWEDLPKGWTDESREKYWESLTGDNKHKITKCMKEMEGKIDDPGAFCASLARQVGYEPE